MIAVIDYGVGNLFSLCSSLTSIGVDAKVTNDEKAIKDASKIILPGVGAFGDAMDKLKVNDLDQLIIDQAQQGKDLMGICLGMQMLFENSCEFGSHKGLGLLKGSVVPMEGQIPAGLKIPHMGWNALDFTRQSDLLRFINDKDFVYFVHSYHATGCEESLVATSDYGIPVTAAVQKDNVMGCQFHPEKSGKTGLEILRAFCTRSN